MQYKAIEFTFPRELTEEQENLFISDFQDIRDQTIAKLKLARKQYDNPIYKKIAGSMADTIMSSLEWLMKNIHQVLILEKTAPGKYRFLIAFKMLQGFDVEVGPIKVKTFWKKLQDKFTNKFRKNTCRKIGFNPDEVIIDFREVEIEDK
jgi:hypothetical protein